MIFQRFLKGVRGVTRQTARKQLDGGRGLVCNWWRRVDPLPSAEIPERLNEANLLRHLNAYDRIDATLPGLYGQYPFGDYSPFISLTAGTVERDLSIADHRVFPAWLTALDFATEGFQNSGFVYHGYVNVLGPPAVKLQEFA